MNEEMTYEELVQLVIELRARIEELENIVEQIMPTVNQCQPAAHKP